MQKEYLSRIPVIEVGDYSTQVLFNKACFICEKKLTTNDTLIPVVGGELTYAIPSYGAIYRLIGDGAAAPIFDSLFVKAKSSGDYDITDNVVNLIVFLYDGATFWYTITQPV
jgi:hypothetical protein